jgi:hypothetical protein
MGACYSRTSQEASLSPKHKSPHKKQNNGLDIKIEYTPAKLLDLFWNNMHPSVLASTFDSL